MEFVHIETPKMFANIMKREIIQRAWITRGKRSLYILTNKNLYFDRVITYSFTRDGRMLIVCESGLFIKTSFFQKGNTFFLTEMYNLKDVIVL